VRIDRTGRSNLLALVFHSLILK